ncbi:hypothetical protein J6590_082447 [Homalodisca vitripennis]|nr:hypothetical protein J6590_082447 [Homalodisca vitripennis]
MDVQEITSLPANFEILGCKDRSLRVKDYCSPRHKGVLPPTYFYSRSGTELASKEATSTPPQMYPSQNLALLELSTVLNFLS